MSSVIYGKDDITGSNDPVAITSNTLHVAQYVWSTDELDWIKQTGGTGGAPASSVEVTNFPATQVVSGTVTTAAPTYSQRYDQPSDTEAYYGEAAIASAEGSSAWRIKKLAFSGANVTVLWANGAAAFSNVWTNRASLSYS